MLSPSDIRSAVADVLTGADIHLCSYQILDRLPNGLRDLIIQERGFPGSGSGNSYSAASLVTDAVEKILPSLEPPHRIYIETEGATYTVAGQALTPGNLAIAFYLLKSNKKQENESDIAVEATFLSENDVENKKIVNSDNVGILGVLLLMIGVFTPIIKIPLIGELNYFQNGKGDGTIILVIATYSLLLIFSKMKNGLWITGFSCLGLLSFTFFNLTNHLGNTGKFMGKSMSNNPFEGIAEIFFRSVQLQWGWILLIAGSILVIISASLNYCHSTRNNKTKLIYRNIAPITGMMLFILSLTGSFVYAKAENEQLLINSQKKQDEEFKQKQSIELNIERKKDAIRKLKILDWGWKKSNNSDFRYVIGSIRNDSGYNIEYVDIKIDFTDVSGDKISTGSDIIELLAPGETWKFKIPVFDDRITQAKIKEVNGISE